MRKVRCYECGKQYDYDEDGFCPGCGAFNQPPRASRISADGAVVRMDGLNERNHVKSFLHGELHTEDRERRRIGLEGAVRRQIPSTQVRPPATARWGASYQKKDRQNPVSVVVWVVFAIILLNMLTVFFGRLF